jgi:hypothetical protein
MTTAFHRSHGWDPPPEFRVASADVGLADIGPFPGDLLSMEAGIGWAPAASGRRQADHAGRFVGWLVGHGLILTGSAMGRQKGTGGKRGHC